MGPGNVRTSNVLQNMECVESFPLGYVGFCLLCLGWGFLFSSLLSLVSDCIEIRFRNFFFYKLQQRAEQRKHSNSLWFTVMGELQNDIAVV